MTFLGEYKSILLNYVSHEICIIGKGRQLRVAWKDGNVEYKSTGKSAASKNELEKVKRGPLQSSDEGKLKQLLSV